jgi:CheY-like chemotaxis protein
MLSQPVAILLVEDNEDDIVIIREAFVGSTSLRIIDTVSDGDEALAYLRQEGPYKDKPLPTLLLLDINMPKKNGFEVMQAIKADPQLRALPVIMLTMSEREEDITRSYAAGACSYIRKPVAFDDFHTVVKLFERYWTTISRVPVPQG